MSQVTGKDNDGTIMTSSETVYIVKILYQFDHNIIQYF